MMIRGSQFHSSTVPQYSPQYSPQFTVHGFNEARGGGLHATLSTSTLHYGVVSLLMIGPQEALYRVGKVVIE